MLYLRGLVVVWPVSQTPPHKTRQDKKTTSITGIKPHSNTEGIFSYRSREPHTVGLTGPLELHKGAQQPEQPGSTLNATWRWLPDFDINHQRAI